MIDLLSAFVVFLLLCVSASLGVFVRPRLPALHRDHETVQMMVIVTGMLVSFSVLVLGLLTSSIKDGYNDASHHRQEYALQLTRLDQCLRNYGPATRSARADIASYTAGVVASTWPLEAPPLGMSYPDTTAMPRVGANPVLADLLTRAELDIDGLVPTSLLQTNLAASCRQSFREMFQARFAVIEDVQGEFSKPFFRVLVFWLMIIFASFGLIAPRHSLSVISIVLCAVSLSTAIFVIVDLSHPYVGLFGLSSDSMRAALAAMMAPAT